MGIYLFTVSPPSMEKALCSSAGEGFAETRWGWSVEGAGRREPEVLRSWQFRQPGRQPKQPGQQEAEQETRRRGVCGAGVGAGARACARREKHSGRSARAWECSRLWLESGIPVFKRSKVEQFQVMTGAGCGPRSGPLQGQEREGLQCRRSRSLESRKSVVRGDTQVTASGDGKKYSTQVRCPSLH